MKEDKHKKPGKKRAWTKPHLVSIEKKETRSGYVPEVYEDTTFIS